MKTISSCRSSTSAAESSCLPFKVSCEREGDPASAVQSVGDVDDLQFLGVPQLLQVLLYLILDNRGQHLLNLPQLDEELSLVRQHRLCEGCRTACHFLLDSPWTVQNVLGFYLKTLVPAVTLTTTICLVVS